MYVVPLHLRSDGLSGAAWQGLESEKARSEILAADRAACQETIKKLEKRLKRATEAGVQANLHQSLWGVRTPPTSAAARATATLPSGSDAPLEPYITCMHPA